jgi:hypothetical protein
MDFFLSIKLNIRYGTPPFNSNLFAAVEFDIPEWVSV